MKNRPFVYRLRVAFAGLLACWRRERSFRTQAVTAAVAVLVLVALRPPAIWNAAVALAAGLVLVAEVFNAALEALADRLHPEIHPEIRVVKDMAAAAVLLASVVAVVVGVLLLVQLYALHPAWRIVGH